MAILCAKHRMYGLISPLSGEDLHTVIVSQEWVSVVIKYLTAKQHADRVWVGRQSHLSMGCQD